MHTFRLSPSDVARFLLAIAVLSPAAPALADTSSSATVTRATATLSPSPNSSAPDAKGNASYYSRTDDLNNTYQTLRVEVSKLVAGSQYQFSADGISLGTFTAAGRDGRVVLVFRDPTVIGGEQFPPGLSPVTNLTGIQVADAATGTVVLSGSFGAPVVTQLDYTRTAATLAPPDAASAVGGVARTKYVTGGTNTVQALHVRLHGLTAGSSYTVTIDGVNFGTYQAVGQDGRLLLDFRSPARQGNHDFPPGSPLTIDMQTIEVTDSSGAVVLTGNFAPVTGS